MNIIILAAGVGSRAYPLTKDTPKCLLRIGYKTIIERNLEIINQIFPRSLVNIVTGFKSDMIDRCLGKGRFNTLCMKNPFYRVTNSIVSLDMFLKASGALSGALLILNGDICFSKDFLRIIDINNSSDSDLIFYDSGRSCTDADYKVVVNKEGFVKDMGKIIKGDKYSGEYAGAVKLSPQAIFPITKKIATMIDLEDYNTWYETALLHCVKEKTISLRAVDVCNTKWVEIDKATDLKRAEEMFSEED